MLVSVFTSSVVHCFEHGRRWYALKWIMSHTSHYGETLTHHVNVSPSAG